MYSPPENGSIDGDDDVYRVEIAFIKQVLPVFSPPITEIRLSVWQSKLPEERLDGFKLSLAASANVPIIEELLYSLFDVVEVKVSLRVK
ncbi:hypothetical protein HK096_000161 [Nowakowskiella sp. JEL0078]|nr:hypothetical protein HK096_000161 [Nowakowskiella sp. JEL0078]